MPNKTTPFFPLTLNIRSTKHLALNLNYDLEGIQYFQAQKARNVSAFKLVQRKNGKSKKRVVYNPSPGYKKLLRAINARFLKKAVFPEGVLGGLVGKTIGDMAAVHCSQEAVLSLDLKDFFPSIKAGRLVKFFRHSGCSPEIAGILTDLLTFNGALPQGFPTSPLMANLIAYGLDVQHLSLAEKFKLQRTRWIDDIVFSGRSKDLTMAASSLLGAVKPHGFKLNNKKTEYTVRKNNPVVVGLDVSGMHPHIPIVVVEKLREILYECVASGVKVVQANYESDALGKKKDLESSLRGRIQHILRFNQRDGEELLAIFNSIAWN